MIVFLCGGVAYRSRARHVLKNFPPGNCRGGTLSGSRVTTRLGVPDIRGVDVLKILAVTLSLGTLAGVNLYLTVFVTGMAVRFDWIALPVPLHGLEILAHPIVIGVAGVLYLIEFFADKIPWIDTAWDSVHTFIRPVGAAALAVAAVGEAHPAFEIVAALLAGGVALSAHTAKAGTRLAANTSPEPFTNIGLSLFEDGLVLGGLALLAWNPLVAGLLGLIVFLTVLAVIPRLWRAIRTHLWFAWKKLNCPADDKKPPSPPDTLPHAWEKRLRRAHSSKSPIAWAAPCVSRKGTLLAANISGWLVGLSEEPSEIYFIGRTWHGTTLAALAIRGATVDFREGFLSDLLEITHRDGKPRQGFLFELLWSKATRKLASMLQEDAA